MRYCADFQSQVVANAVTALTDIHAAASGQSQTSETERALFIITQNTLQKLLIALNECTEWGRVAILTALSRYKAQDEQESEHICERVVPQFQHVNGSVVLAAMKVSIMHQFICAGGIGFIVVLGHYDSFEECTA